ncbi:MAG: zinc dependent phospholipase C family protein [Atopobiaceae bacterium]
MPAILTHDFFGQDAFGAALEVADMMTPPERDAFLLGNQGPDPFFYLALDPIFGTPFKQVGQRMHHENPSGMLTALVRALTEDSAGDTGVARAYVAGFICHYVLDSTMHPFVYFWQNGLAEQGVPGLDQNAAGKVHAEIERDLDEMVLFAKRNQTILTYRPYERVLKASPRVLIRIGHLYAPLVSELSHTDEADAAWAFPRATERFRLIQHLFYAPGIKLDVLSTLERTFTREEFSMYRAMAHRVRPEAKSDFDNVEHLPWKNPFTGEVSEASFWDLYEQALLKVPAALSALLDGGDVSVAAHMVTRGKNFSGEVVERVSV